MRTEYGMPVPRGVRKDWEANSMGCEGAGGVLRRYHTPPEWGDPAKCVAWFDRFERLRVIAGHYENQRSATVRIDANGKWSATFGAAPRQPIPTRRAETRSKAPSPMGSAVAKPDAQTPNEYPHP
jgi:hypothetical protein